MKWYLRKLKNFSKHSSSHFFVPSFDFTVRYACFTVEFHLLSFQCHLASLGFRIQALWSGEPDLSLNPCSASSLLWKQGLGTSYSREHTQVTLNPFTCPVHGQHVQPHCLSFDGWPWETCLISLQPVSLPCKMGITIPSVKNYDD